MTAEFAWIEGQHQNGCTGLGVIRSGEHPDPWDWSRPTVLGNKLKILSCLDECCDAKLVGRADADDDLLRAFASLPPARG